MGQSLHFTVLRFGGQAQDVLVDPSSFEQFLLGQNDGVAFGLCLIKWVSGQKV
jgi:hypothetical protein